MDDPALEFHQLKELFLHFKTSRPTLWLNVPPIEWVPEFSSEGTAAGTWSYSSPCSADLKDAWICFSVCPHRFTACAGTVLPLPAPV